MGWVRYIDACLRWYCEKCCISYSQCFMQLKLFFSQVTFAKPKSSRNSSIGKSVSLKGNFNWYICLLRIFRKFFSQVYTMVLYKVNCMPNESFIVNRCFTYFLSSWFLFPGSWKMFESFHNHLSTYQTEAFAVCENYSPPEGFKEKDLYHLLEKVGTPSGADDLGNGTKLKMPFVKCQPNTWYRMPHSILSCADCRSGWLEGSNKVYIPFLACGDLSGYDSDRSYPLTSTEGGSYQSLDPVQPPIAPPYKTALEMKKVASHGIGADISKLSLDSWTTLWIAVCVLVTANPVEFANCMALLFHRLHKRWTETSASCGCYINQKCTTCYFYLEKARILFLDARCLNFYECMDD